MKKEISSLVELFISARIVPYQWQDCWNPDSSRAILLSCLTLSFEY